MWFDQLPTPAAVVDLGRLEHNCAAMAERAHRLGVRLRPHVKTHKCVPAGRLQVKGHFGGITVSTLAEARHFAAAGFDDLTYAVPLAPARVGEVAELARTVRHLGLLVDHPDTVRVLAEHGRRHGCRFEVWLKVDCGAGRAGVDPRGAGALTLAAQVQEADGLDLRGLLTHAGHAYSCRTRAEVEVVAAQERDVMVRLRERLGTAGIDALEISIGSTPTLCAADNLEGVTEVRPGNYVFFDAFQTAIGSCRLDDAAFHVLATVIGCYPQRRRLVVDAGALALSKDPGPRQVDPGCGYGVLTSADGVPLAGLRLSSLSQEHGVVEGDSPAAVADLRPGTRVRIVPNHSCLAAALYDTYHVLDGERVVDRWQPVRGW